LSWEDELENAGENRLFQPNLHAATGIAGAGTSGTQLPLPRFVAPASERLKAARKRLETLGIGLGTEISTDLGDGIGSRGWWLGLTACLGLTGGAVMLGTMVAPIPALQRQQLTPAQREAVKPQAIAPLAVGGATGRINLPDARLVVPLAEAPERPRLELTARMNGSFDAVLRRAGVSRDDLAAAMALIRPHANLAALPKGMDVDLVLGRRETKSVPRPLDHLGLRAAFDLRLVLDRVDGALQLRRIPIAVDSTPLRVKGSVGGNLGRSLRSAGIPANLANEFVKTLGFAVDMQRGIGRKDRFDIVIERDVAETGEVRYGRLMYVGLDRGNKDPIELGRFDVGGSSQFYRGDGESARKGLMRTPVEGARLTSGFGMRFHPLLAYSRMHQGVDFGAPHGAPILAAAGGTISFAGRHGGHGNYVMIKHNKDLSTAYAHMSRFAVRPGQQVAQGQVIGYVGSTGMSTGPHLHYEVWLRGRATNPVSLKFIGGNQLSGRNLQNFYSMMNRMRALTVAGAVETPKAASRGRRSTRA
jgi:murein DD-endopeptidase MepM/ murein hydrolase activator NlpD